MSEYNDDFRPRRESFIERNRIIAGLSDALLVTEAALKSGSLHTAKFALELGRPVLAVPGDINKNTSEGTNSLIKLGAKLVTGFEDIAEELQLNPSQKQMIYGDTPAEQTIIELIQSGVNDGEELQVNSKLSPAEFQQTLTMLEIKGVITPLGNNSWRIK